MNDLNEIKEALQAHGSIKHGLVPFMSKEWHECRMLNQKLAHNAPEWLACLVEQVEEAKADALQIGRNWQNDRHELFKALEEMQKTQSLILKRVADISPALASSIIQEFGLEGASHDHR